MLDYISKLPLPAEQIPLGLKDLLFVEDNSNPQRDVTVTHRYEKNKYQDDYDYTHMIMAVVPEDDVAKLRVLRESSEGVVTYSTPDCTVKGGAWGINISISGYGYIVASWGSSSHNSFFLAEDVWMKLGLKPRLIGDDEQKVIFDEVTSPSYGVAQGDVSSEYYFKSNKDVKWTMRNDYLRKYLWMKGCVGVKVFFFEAFIERTKEVLSLLSGSNHYVLSLPWIDFEIVDHGDRIILQAWGTVQSVQPELCVELDVNTLIWPGHTAPMTMSRASDYRRSEYVYVDDAFLIKYEKDKTYEAIPFFYNDHYQADPSYGGQWAFRDCIRVGRNLVKLPFYELYRGVPEREIYHVFDYAKDQNIIDVNSLDVEHIVSKTFRFARELANLNDNLVSLGRVLDVHLSSSDIFEYNKDELDAEGLRNYPVLQKLSHVASSDMQEQDFLARCKTINEIINKIRMGSLKKLNIAMGVNTKDVEKLQTLKLLQGILNLTEAILEQNEEQSALKHANELANFNSSNLKLAALFINNDLRNSEAHEAVDKSIGHLAKLGFDSATLASGYSHALDFLFDKIIESLECINIALNKVLQ
ncbi:TPA: hypothetical protein ACGBQ2_004962 [Yersinia enterocolitica]|nr:hypothetical protein [Yersinia enterocolitica]HDL7372537.1 hypothetical protein [Yersinia enterocolitica]HDL7373464.1 hypothetical protein [Yersinia enterocolitica]HDL7697787.1 hypothetical protein [Yersinia enterocolitica]HDL8189503.1 hypothetical protein [Yersinia enterocolitica]